LLRGRPLSWKFGAASSSDRGFKFLFLALSSQSPQTNYTARKKWQGPRKWYCRHFSCRESVCGRTGGTLSCQQPGDRCLVKVGQISVTRATNGQGVKHRTRNIRKRCNVQNHIG